MRVLLWPTTVMRAQGASERVPGLKSLPAGGLIIATTERNGGRLADQNAVKNTLTSVYFLGNDFLQH